MAIRPIRLFGDPVLRRRAIEVVDFDTELRQLVTDLTDTMLEAPGAGLAAPQIGVGLRVFTWNVDGEVGHLINPSLDLSAELQDGPEGCLSLPELTYDCIRALSVVATGFNMYGDPVRIEGSELLARAIQHETDHLDGVLFIDRLDDDARKAAMREIRESEWFGLERPDGQGLSSQHRGLCFMTTLPATATCCAPPGRTLAALPSLGRRSRHAIAPAPCHRTPVTALPTAAGRGSMVK